MSTGRGICTFSFWLFGHDFWWGVAYHLALVHQCICQQHASISEDLDMLYRDLYSVQHMSSCFHAGAMLPAPI